MRKKKILQKSKKMNKYNYSYWQKLKLDEFIRDYLIRKFNIRFNCDNINFEVYESYYEPKTKECIVVINTLYGDGFKGKGGCFIPKNGEVLTYGDFTEFIKG